MRSTIEEAKELIRKIRFQTVQTANNGSRFEFILNEQENILFIFKDDGFHAMIEKTTKEDFLREVHKFMDSWNSVN